MGKTLEIHANSPRSIKATSKNNVVSNNTVIEPDGYSDILLKNIGDSAAVINDNIPLAVGDSFTWNTFPGVKIDENTLVRFTENLGNPKVLIFKVYYR